MVVTEATAVEARGRITPSCTGIWKDEHITGWKRIVEFIKSQGSVPAMQLAHSGRKGSTSVIWKGRGESIPDDQGGWPTIAPSAIPFQEKDKVPKETTLEDIEEIQQAFVSAAKRAIKAGFQVIELDYAHGYLPSTFLSSHSNKRTDRYGGSLENRMRFCVETTLKVRQVIPEEMPLMVRISVSDFADNGWDVQQSIELAKQLKAVGADLVDCSSGGVVSGIEYGPFNSTEVQHKAAQTIQRDAGIPTAAVGKIINPLLAEKLLQDKNATLIFIGRAFLNNPHWPYMAADTLANPETFKYPDSYDWCIGWKGFYKWRQELQEAFKE